VKLVPGLAEEIAAERQKQAEAREAAAPPSSASASCPLPAPEPPPQDGFGNPEEEEEFVVTEEDIAALSRDGSNIIVPFQESPLADISSKAKARAVREDAKLEPKILKIVHEGLCQKKWRFLSHTTLGEKLGVQRQLLPATITLLATAILEEDRHHRQLTESTVADLVRRGLGKALSYVDSARYDEAKLVCQKQTVSQAQHDEADQDHHNARCEKGRYLFRKSFLR